MFFNLYFELGSTTMYYENTHWFDSIFLTGVDANLKTLGY